MSYEDLPFSFTLGTNYSEQGVGHGNTSRAPRLAMSQVRKANPDASLSEWKRLYREQVR